MEFILVVLAAIAVHRIWNYEQVFAAVRGWITHFVPPKLGYVFTCAACNALWSAVLVVCVFLVDHPVAKAAILVFAIYSVIRFQMWAGSMPWKGLFTQQQIKQSPKLLEPFTHKPIKKSDKDLEGCSDCEQNKADTAKEHARVRLFKKRVVIMTTLSDFHASYSLTSCVLDQARALSANKDWLIQVWVMQITNDSLWPKDMPKNVELRKHIPMVKWKDDDYDPKVAGILAATISRELVALGNADVITHDLLFQRAFLNFAAAIHSIVKLKNFRWWHQAHSGPSSFSERPVAPVLYRHSLPEGHRLLNINSSHVAGFMEHYQITSLEQIDTCPNVRDPRILYGASPEISAFISDKQLLMADVMQVYPVSTERSFDKGVQHVIKVFGSLKHQGRIVRLVLANAHANGNEDFITKMKKIAIQWGLTDKEFIITSEYFLNNKSAGLSAANTQMLFRISNVFVFPTTAEASSLVLTEAALAGNLMVLNKDIPSINSDLPDCELTYPFGTSNDPEKWPGDCPSPDHIAEKISAALERSPTNCTQRRILRNRNLDTIGEQLTGFLTRAG